MYVETKKKLTGARLNGAEDYSRRQYGVPVDPEKFDDLLHSRMNELNATSAYWGCTGEIPPKDPNDHVQDVFRFKPEINKKLIPLPREVTSFPKKIDESHIGFHIVRGDGNADNGGLNQAQQQMLDGSNAEIGPDGRPRSRFLNLKTEYMRMPHLFNPKVLGEHADGIEKDNRREDARNRLQQQPLCSEDPNPYVLTSDDFCDMSKVDPSSYRVEGDWEKVSKLPLGERRYVYKSFWNAVNREGPVRREKTQEILQREHDVNPQELRAVMLQERLKDMPRGYKPPKTEWMSTTHREHANYDIQKARDANNPDSTTPLSNINYRLAPSHHEAVRYHDERARTKLDGNWATEYGDSFQDRYNEAEMNKDYAKKTIFDVRYGIYTIDPAFHHPRDDVSTGEVYKPHEIVPQQYVSMAAEPLMAKNWLSFIRP